VAVQAGPLWHRRYPDQRCPDFDLCQTLLAEQSRWATTGRYTVNYRVGRSADSVQAEFFLRGNQVMQERNRGGFPWRAPGAVSGRGVPAGWTK